jgi:plastocyanin
MATFSVTIGVLDSAVVRPLALPAAVVLAVTLVGAAGCNRETGGSVGVTQTTLPAVGTGPVTIKGIAYNPKEVHVKVGEQLVWNWDDNGLEHTVTADDNSFTSGRKSSGSWPYTFNKAGTIAYHCEIHRQMHGTVIVS